MVEKVQRIYAEKEEQSITLSPYARVTPLNSTQIQIQREDKRTTVILTASDLITLRYLIETLNNGIKKEHLIVLLKNLGVKDPLAWMELCLRRGIIE